MTALIILINVAFAVLLVAGMVALHGSAIAAEQRANGAGAGPSRGTARVRPRIHFPSVRATRTFDPATD